MKVEKDDFDTIFSHLMHLRGLSRKPVAIRMSPEFFRSALLAQGDDRLPIIMSPCSYTTAFGLPLVTDPCVLFVEVRSVPFNP